MAPHKRRPAIPFFDKKTQGKNKKQAGNTHESQAQNPRPQKSPQKTQSGAKSSTEKSPAGKYPCLICSRQATFLHSPKPRKIGKVNITGVELSQEKYYYDLANIHCSKCETFFATVVGQLSSAEQVYERWRWAVETFGNFQRILEHATR